ncbi:MAG: nitrile hydratase subunit beta [Alphaproteobacteria bacterium]|nr:nitrile hydratase subunit beta [Alphaproteobacteria bacterium]
MSEQVSSYNPAPGHLFEVGDAVTVKVAYPPGHCRTPFYIRGKHGVVERICGTFHDPETLAYGTDGTPERILYRVRFAQNQVWPDYVGPKSDTLDIEIYEHWLQTG